MSGKTRPFPSTFFMVKLTSCVYWHRSSKEWQKNKFLLLLMSAWLPPPSTWRTVSACQPVCVHADGTFWFDLLARRCVPPGRCKERMCPCRSSLLLIIDGNLGRCPLGGCHSLQHGALPIDDQLGFRQKRQFCAQDRFILLTYIRRPGTRELVCFASFIKFVF